MVLVLSTLYTRLWRRSDGAHVPWPTATRNGCSGSVASIPQCPRLVRSTF